MTLLVGPPKTGKSLFVRNLLRSISLGEEFLGLKTTACSSGYFALEEHPSFLQKSFKDAGMDRQSIHIHYGPAFGSEEDLLGYLTDYCLQYQIRFLVIDPMAKFMDIVDTNDYVKVYKKLSKLSEFARKQNVHIMIVHHSNKSTRPNGESTNQILGSTGIFGVSDGVFILSRKDKQGSLHSNLRYGIPLGNCSFSYDENGVLNYLGSKVENSNNTLSERVITQLTYFGPQSFNELNEALKIKRETLGSGLNELVINQKIAKSGKGVRGSEHVYSIPDIGTLKQESNEVSL